MPMIERSEAELLKKWNDHEDFIVFFYSPFCGTCKLAERMLDILLKAHAHLSVLKTNILYTPKLTQMWKIESIPCLAFVKRDHSIKKEYALRSIDHLLQLLSAEA
ncbi:MAG: hypothetical protein A2189_01095 [Paenibacillus sp. RIFOXYA1_FULL_44_5]|nr:MAG: hypothetical protein A2189_01095 [Paenibacillus sp. RIFOXYA1_FULL_44_5]